MLFHCPVWFNWLRPRIWVTLSNGTHLARLWKLILLTLMRTCFFLWNLKGSGSIGKSSINGITKIETFAVYDFSSCLCLILTFDWGHSTKSSSRDLTICELIMNVSQRHPLMKKGCTQILKCHLVGGFKHEFYVPFQNIRDVILPIDELHHFSRWLLHHQPV